MTNDLILEYKEQIKLLKEQVEELEKSNKSKDYANKRCLQKLENATMDLEQAKEKIKDLEETNQMLVDHP
jgi:ribosomal protein S15P/S13E